MEDAKKIQRVGLVISGKNRMSDEHNDLFLDDQAMIVLRRLAEDAKSNPGESIASHRARFEKRKKALEEGCRKGSAKDGVLVATNL